MIHLSNINKKFFNEHLITYTLSQDLKVNGENSINIPLITKKNSIIMIIYLLEKSIVSQEFYDHLSKILRRKICDI